MRAREILFVGAVLSMGARLFGGEGVESDAGKGARAMKESSGGGARIWVAARTDDAPGTGSAADPYNGGTAERLDALMETFRSRYGAHLVIEFGSGVFEGTHPWIIENHWKVRGAGRGITVFRTRADSGAVATVGFVAKCPPGHDWTGGFELSDCTFDFNVPNLRKANRAFLLGTSARGSEVSYVYVEDTPPPAWRAEQNYARGALVAHEGRAYIGVAPRTGTAPAQDETWSRLQPTQASPLAPWDGAAAYVPGDAVAYDGAAWICAEPSDRAARPGAAGSPWLPVSSDRPDPAIYTSAADVWSGYGGGHNEVRRVRMLNGYGSSFFDRECFLVKLGGDDCVIEDCQVDRFLGDYSTCLVVFGGHNNVIRGCTVRGNGSPMLFAYGGWENLDNVFENNFAYGVRIVTNIDSLRSKNVIFRNNVFMGCRQAGIGINVNGGNTMDGLFIHDNLIEMADDAELSAIQLGQDSLRNVRVWNNVLRTVSGKAPVKAMTIGSGVRNLTVCNNVCDPEMVSLVPPHAVCYDNYDLQGRPMRGLRQRGLRDAGVAPPPALDAARDPRDPAAPVRPLESVLSGDGEIMDWLVLAPFPHPPEARPEGISLGAGYGFDFLSAVGGESGVNPRAGLSVAIRFPEGAEAEGLWKPAQREARRVAWQRVRANVRGVVDALEFPEVKQSPDSTCLYAFCLLRSEGAQEVVLRWGSDDGCVLFVGGKKVAERLNDRRGYRRDGDEAVASLAAGDTPLLLKVCNCWGGFCWGMRVTRPDGKPAEGVSVVLP